jgi:hypothetical protein
LDLQCSLNIATVAHLFIARPCQRMPLCVN